MITVYSNGCPQCNVLKNLLDSKKIEYKLNTNIDEMLSIGITHLPMVKLENDELISFKEAFNKFNEV